MKGTEKKYQVLIDDNYDYMDEGSRHCLFRRNWALDPVKLGSGIGA